LEWGIYLFFRAVSKNSQRLAMGRGRCEAEIDTVYRFQAETGGRLPAAPGCDEGNVTAAPVPGLYSFDNS